MPSDSWGRLPEVTVPEITILEPLNGLINPVVDIVPDRETVFSWFGIRTVCCGSDRGKVGAKQYWETANLGFWDFRARETSAIALAYSLRKQLNAATTEYETLTKEGNHEEAERIWQRANAVIAKEMRQHAEHSKGLYVKATQQMSTMAGVLPDCYLEEFTKTTADLPVSSPEEVYTVIERNLLQDPKEIFKAFDREPVASASIGQVHKAKLRDSGKLVAVKVQHDGVERVFMEDLRTLASIADHAYRWMPQMDLRPAVEEFQTNTPIELDFREETKAVSIASKALKRFGSAARVPTPVEHLCSKQVMVMDFIAGMPITTLARSRFCRENGINKHRILTTLMEAFAMLTFREGCIHGDPHAGNIHLIIDERAPGGGAPVIFDWGMTKMLTDTERLSLAKLFHSLANMDMSGIFDALELLGFKFGKKMTDQFQEEMVNRLRSSMKDTIGKDQTRARARASMEEIKNRKDDGEFDGLVSEWPKCILLFLRMMECMRGLCVTCEAAGLPVLDIFTSQARTAVMEATQKPSLLNSVRFFGGRRAHTHATLGDAEGSDELGIASALTGKTRVSLPYEKTSALEQRVRSCCAALKKDGAIVGVQVAVVQAGKVVCDVAYGTQSTIDMREIEPRTRFPLIDAIAGIATVALLRDCYQSGKDAGASSNGSMPRPPGVVTPDPLDVLVTDIWPQFASGKSTMTLSQLLGHAAGVQDAFPSDFAPQYLNSVESMRAHFERITLPGKADPRYVYLLQLFLILIIMECKRDKSVSDPFELEEWLESQLGELGLDLVVPDGKDGEAVICRDLPSLSRVSMTEVEEAAAKRQAPKPVETEPGTKCKMIDCCQEHPIGFDPLRANVNRSTGSHDQLRAGFSLAASACGLATMLSSPELHEELRKLGALEPAGEDATALGWLLTAGACRWNRGGLQYLELHPQGLRALCRKPVRGYGVISGLGTSVVSFPDLAEGGVSLAITVNNVLQGRKAAAQLAAEVFSYYGYRPGWTQIPLRVTSEALRILAESKMAQKVLTQIEGSDETKRFNAALKCGCLSIAANCTKCCSA